MLDVKFSELVGKTITRIKVNDDKDKIDFECGDGAAFQMYHSQDCCESVGIEDIAGDLQDLIGTPVLVAEEVTNSETHPEGFEPGKGDFYVDESFTWTFYKIDTERGGVTIRWLGSSNGYYSESVDFCRIK